MAAGAEDIVDELNGNSEAAARVGCHGDASLFRKAALVILELRCGLEAARALIPNPDPPFRDHVGESQ